MRRHRVHHRGHRALRISVLALSGLLAGGCDALEKALGDEGSPSAKSASDEEDGSAAKGDADPSPAEAPKDRADPPADSGGTIAGKVSLSIDGVAKSFEHLPRGDAILSPITTSFRAKPEAGAKEQLTLQLIYFDPRKAEIPTTLKLEIGGQAAAKAIRSPKPMVSYTSPDAVAYASYVTAHVESWKNGTLSGTIEDITLYPGRDNAKGASPIELADISFSVTLD